MMEIQQHDSVVVDVAGLVQGFAELLQERERGVAGRREAPKAVLCCPPSPPLYRPPGGAPALEIRSKGGGGGQVGGKGCLAPQGKGELPPRVTNPRRIGKGPRGRLAPSPLRGWFPSTYSP